MSGGKVVTANRLLGSAVAGLKDPKQRAPKAAAKPPAEPGARPAAPKGDAGVGVEAPAAGPAGQEGKKARGRGTTAFGSAGGPGLRYADEREHVEWRAGGGPSGGRERGADADRWSHDHFEDGPPGPRRRGRGNRRSEPYDDGADRMGGAERMPMRFVDEGPRWSNDKYDGPGTVGSAVFVRNLPMEVAEPAILAELFGGVGQVVSVQVDAGALATATVGYTRQDAAEEAERRYHGRWVHGCQIKVSAKTKEPLHAGGGDEDFWRKELKAMPKRGKQADYDMDMDGPPRRGAPPAQARGGTRMRGRGASALAGGRVSIFDRMG